MFGFSRKTKAAKPAPVRTYEKKVQSTTSIPELLAQSRAAIQNAKASVARMR